MNFIKRKVFLFFLTCLIVTVAIATISVVSAKDITISPTTHGGLKKAIESAENGDTIYLKNGVYNGKDNTKITIDKNITIKGAGSQVFLDGSKKSFIFNIKKKNVLLKNLNFINCKGNNGGAIYSQANLTINSCTFTNNYGIGDGGAVYSYNGNLTLINCNFKNNKAKSNGGAIYSEGDSNMNSCSFTNNQAENDRGGAIVSYNGKLTLNKIKFTKNIAKNYGGAIFSEETSTIKSSTFTSNKAGQYGGAIYNYGTMTIANSNFKNNIEAKNYNAIYNSYLGKLSKNNVKINPNDGTKVK